ncbi:secretion protein HlyD [Rhizorhabdus dicambivorans]|uniref:Secretion protein HlyD n=1 Tax=Rhizorhabdus dicambivorans TaxID=1850238 RepID=A0A2A4FQB4_9SPHN|nr:secretion protein HlyD [Rhizorhabdus dicambivorans]ATE65140.1 secretion protein HlyD [Rhizorhabdus dicambivorans]PCE39910.1 secretion protein HlyD [Rhizorhabdus dicambivorans]
MRRRRQMIALLVVAGGLTAAGLHTQAFGLWADRDNELILYGNVDIRQVDLGFRVGGRIAEMPVDEGARVAAGSLLAQLDPGPLRDAVAVAEARVGAARAELAKRRAGNRPQEVAQASAAVAARRADLARARESFERRRTLVSTGAVSQAAFEAAQAEYLAAQAQLQSAEQSLSLQRAGFRREDVAAAEAQLAAAIAERDAARTSLIDATLRAPSAGTLLTRAREPGAIVQRGETVFTLTIDRPLRVRAYVAEPDLGRVAPGMRVHVTSDGSRKAYDGVIGFISPTAEFTPKTVQTEDLRTDLVYRLRINITNPDDRLRQGQPVTVGLVEAGKTDR